MYDQDVNEKGLIRGEICYSCFVYIGIEKETNCK